ncbi:hypothetical protein OO013_05625 [Mangrovivirga sp. M17]|uniref:Uncharacterized protein n=1 Tax=Mangrovivirga halotolerans TaxID=2993936 RepID=A0ABT3RPP1_9BACT|nr:hypothetical protein [Mangrovivirga halotolerans]MCX2743334.1 hypothetical protein [Mangrovivirga halotolerans]
MERLINLCLVMVLFMAISCNDDDEVEALPKVQDILTTSLTDYENAADDRWVQITEEEYNLLRIEMVDVNVCGLYDSAYVATTAFSNGSNSFTRANNVPDVVPPNNYVFAFRYEAYFDYQTSSSFEVKLSTESNNTGFKTIARPLPSHTGGNFYYFALKKGADAFTGTNEGYVGVYNDIDIAMVEAGSHYYQAGNNTDLPNSNDGYLNKYQALSTPSNPW